MRSVINNLTWILFAVFALPTILVLGSWNSLPGDPLYGVKLGLEQALFVLVSPSYAAQGDLSVKYTERRFSEAKRLLEDKGSVEGLQYLDKQVTTTRDIIEKGGDAKMQAVLAQKYIDTLTDLSAELSAQQQALASTPQPAARAGSTAPAVQPGTPITQLPVTQLKTQVQQPAAGSPQAPSAPVVQAPPVAQQQQKTPPPPAPVAHAPTPPPAQVIAMQQQNTINQINETQRHIQDTIKELQSVAQWAGGSGGAHEIKTEIPKEENKDQKRSDREKGKN